MKGGLPHPNTSSPLSFPYVSICGSPNLSQVVGAQQKDAQGLPALVIVYIGLDSLSSRCVVPLPSWGFLRLPLSVFVFSFLMCSDSTDVSVPARVGPHEGEMLPWKSFRETENSETWRQGGGMER